MPLHVYRPIFFCFISAAMGATLGHSQIPPIAASTTDKTTITKAAELPTIVVTGNSGENHEVKDPSLGTRVYTITQAQIETLPQGSDTPFDQVVERTPGVSQDAYGSWHIRGEDANTSYRINGIEIPQGIVNSTFGEQFDTHFISSVSLIDGTLPAQFGVNTAGIFDMQTKTGTDLTGGEASVYGGSYNTIKPSFYYGGVSGKTNYFYEGSYNHNDLGIENPTGGSSAIHDETNQYKGFAYVSTDLDPTSQLIFIVNAADSDFQIPNTVGIPAAYEIPGVSSFSSGDLNETQNEQFYYGIVSYKKRIDDIQIQSSLVNSYARTLFRPDETGDLLINGLASEQNRSLTENTFQNDITYNLNPYHTIRAGAYFSAEANATDTSNKVFQTDSSGDLLSDTPETIRDNEFKRGYLYGFYIQDQWQACDHLTVNCGIRFDQSDEYVSENQFSPRVNLVYEATPKTTLHIGYARYFTPPQLEYLSPSSLEKYENTTAASEVTTDDNIRAERANYYDAGVSYQATDNWQLGMDGYYKSIRNYADEAQVGDSLIYAPFSYAYGYYVGTEVTSSYHNKGFSTYTNLEVSQAKARDLNSSQFLFSQDELNYTAQHDVHVNHDQLFTLSTGAAYTFSDTTVHMDAFFSSGYYDGFANMNKVNSHCPVNFGIEHHFKLAKADLLTVRFDIVNLLDETYEIHHGDGIGTTAPYYGERRGFFGGISYEF